MIIAEHFDMTLAEKAELMGQVFAKIATNFWPIIIPAIIAGIIIHRQETAARGFGRKH